MDVAEFISQFWSNARSLWGFLEVATQPLGVARKDLVLVLCGLMVAGIFAGTGPQRK